MRGIEANNHCPPSNSGCSIPFGKKQPLSLLHLRSDTTTVPLSPKVNFYPPPNIPFPLSPRVVAAIACEIIPYLGREYQVVFAVHEDKPHLHIHIVSNAISYIDGHRYYGTRQEFNGFKAHIKQVLRRYGIQTLQHVPNRMRNPEF